jgi:ATP-dependent RNA helicase RhlE
LKNSVQVQVDLVAPAKTVAHALYPVPEKLKTKLLLAQLSQLATGRVIVFTRTKRRARNLALDLDNQGYRVTALQGNMAQNARLRSINGFRDGEFDILVATDIAARGIDVTEVSHVINFDMPDTVDAYIHRSGRTGRAHATGEAFTLSSPEDEEAIRAIEKVLGEPLARRRLPDFDYAGFVPEQRPVAARAAAVPMRGGNGNRPARSNGSSRNQRPAQATSPAARPAPVHGATAAPSHRGTTAPASTTSLRGPNRRRRPAQRPVAS